MRLSWRPRSARSGLRHVDGRDEGLAFYFDATPTVVLPDGSEDAVGDALGRVHFLQIEERLRKSRPATADRPRAAQSAPGPPTYGRKASGIVTEPSAF